MTDDYDVRVLKDVELENVYRLRSRVWVATDPGLSEEKRTRWVDPDDSDCIHVGALCIASGSLVCSRKIRIVETIDVLKDAYVFSDYSEVLDGRPLAFFSRLQTDVEHRGKGLAKVVEQFCMDLARERGCTKGLSIFCPVSGPRRRKAIEANGGIVGEPVTHHIRSELLMYPVVYDLGGGEC